MTRNWKEWEGRAVGGFPLSKFVGSSESSAVFLTEREGEPAAIKLLPAAGEAARTQLARWERASQLSHPHLVQLFEHGSAEEEGTPLVFVVMEHAEEVLSDVDRPLSSAEALDMLAPALNALSYLHAKGFAHGRLKPANIMAIQDRLKLSGDDPLRVGERHSHSAMPQPYDAPETEQKGVSPAGDVWSLGMALVQVLTQSLPAWEASGPRLPEALPDSFREIARRCLRQDPLQRSSVAEISQWLQAGGNPTPERGTMRRYLVPVLAGAGLVVAATIAIPYFTGSDAKTPAVASVPEPRKEATKEPAAVPALPPPVTKQPETKPETKPPENAVVEPAPAPAPPPPAPVEEKQPAPAPVATRIATEPPPPGVLQQVYPDVPAKSRESIHGMVPIVVRVHTDASGAVTEATVEAGRLSTYFADLSLKAARQWKFTATEPQEWTLRFQYVRDSKHPVTVLATQH